MAKLRSAAPGGGIHSFNKGCSTPIVTSEGAVKLNKPIGPLASWSFLGRTVAKREGKAEKDSGYVSNYFPSVSCLPSQGLHKQPVNMYISSLNLHKPVRMFP